MLKCKLYVYTYDPVQSDEQTDYEYAIRIQKHIPTHFQLIWLILTALIFLLVSKEKKIYS